jgi:hypothetical protein
MMRFIRWLLGIKSPSEDLLRAYESGELMMNVDVAAMRFLGEM